VDSSVQVQLEDNGSFGSVEQLDEDDRDLWHSGECHMATYE